MEKLYDYDVFLSYRRGEGTYAAHLVHKTLLDLGYSAFLDKMSIQKGKFPDQLVHAINNSKDFVLLVNKDTFTKRIFNKEDWQRKEIETALKAENVNIFVLFLDDTRFPKKLPAEIAEIKDFQGEPLIKDVGNLHDYQKELFAKYLTSKPRPDCIDYKGRSSIYDFDFTNEKDRLKSQGSKYDADNQEILDKYLKKSGYTVLDVGCAQGFVTKQCFRKDKYKKVVGIDFNPDAIKDANKKHPDKFSFHQLDVENEGFTGEMRKIMKKEGIKGFDVISCFLVLHHLHDPEAALQRLKPLLNKGGMIIIRGSDDGTKVSYGDNGLIDKIIKKSYGLSGMSDRNNGRKLYSWLTHLGLSDIRVHSKATNTSDMTYDDKQGLYKVSFSWRINYFRKQVEMNESEKTKADFDEMDDYLTKLLTCFRSNDFWYSVISYVCVGFKK